MALTGGFFISQRPYFLRKWFFVHQLLRKSYTNATDEVIATSGVTNRQCVTEMFNSRHRNFVVTIL